MRIFALLGSVALLSACMANIPLKHSMVSSSDPTEIAWFYEDGQNSVHGSALIRQAVGGVVTCAGALVHIMPVSTYADERMQAIHGNHTSGYSQHDANLINEAPDQAYLDASINATCDAQGFLSFRNLPDGEYYIVVGIQWHVSGYAVQGGGLMKRVALAGGDAVEVVLAP